MKLAHNFRCYGLSLLGGFISVFAYAPFNFMPAIIISLLILILIMQTQRNSFNKLQHFLVGFIYGIGFFASQLYWIFYSLYVAIDTGLIIAVLGFIFFIGFLSLYLGLLSLMFNLLQTRLVVYNLLFLFPSLWVMLEWLRGFIFSGFSWSDISYTQVNNQIFRGVFPLFGSYGVSFILASLVGASYILIRGGINRLNGKFLPHTSFRLTGIHVVIIFLCLGLIKDNSYTSHYGKSISVALVQGNVSQSAKWSSNQFLEVYQRLVAKAKADVVFTPETSISSFAAYLPVGYLANLTSLAKANNASLVAGMPLIVDSYGNYVNAAIALTESRQPYYAKRHLVPFGEYIPLQGLLSKLYKIIALPLVGLSSGADNQPPLVLANQKFAFNICYENGFNSELIANAKQSTIMANLSDMVWYGKTIAAHEHVQLSQARALENQRYFIQDTNNGLTAIINPNGQIQSQIAPFSEGILVDNVYGMIGTTPFQQYGNYPVIICCLLLIMLGLGLSFPRQLPHCEPFE
jgi:apolipoprotein N-acyltransferase